MGEELMTEYNKSFLVSGVYVVKYYADELGSKSILYSVRLFLR
jgi:hypothetical protein